MNNKLPLYIGLAGAIGMGLCDVILLGQPVSGMQYGLSSFEAMQYVSSGRAQVGAMGGLVCGFFICFGFWYLKDLFAPVNKKLSTWLFVSLSSVLFFAGAFHAGYYFLAGIHFSASFPQPVLSNFLAYLEMLSYLGVPGFVIGTVLFIIVAADKRFPAWLKFANPLVLSGLLLLVFSLLPRPLGGYIRPCFINAAWALLFLLTLKATPRGHLG